MKLGKILFLAGLLILVWPVAHTGMVIYRGLDDHTGHAHIGVVFGTGAVSPRLEARISKALALYQAGKLNRFFLTGVRRENRFMYDFLRKHQVPADKIIFDHAGYNTYASVKNLKKYLQENQAEHSASTILAVSQYFHILRIQMTSLLRLICRMSQR